MDLLVLNFWIIIILCAYGAGKYFSRWGFIESIVAAIFVFFIPFLLGKILFWWDDKRFSKTLQGRRRILAEELFDRSFGEKRLKSWRCRPLIGKDGSTIVMIYYGNKKPPKRVFYKFTIDSMEPESISSEEAAQFIEV